MVMRTRNSSTRNRQYGERIVGGGVLEKKLLRSLNDTERRHYESREMECCGKLSLDATDEKGVISCHPYALGEYRKIGVCGGRSIYQHGNRTDIFLYYACGRWFVGLEVGVCGGWIFAKTGEICSHSVKDRWMFVDSVPKQDTSFTISQMCDRPKIAQEKYFPVTPYKSVVAPLDPMPQPVFAVGAIPAPLFRPHHDNVDRAQPSYTIVESDSSLPQLYTKDQDKENMYSLYELLYKRKSIK